MANSTSVTINNSTASPYTAPSTVKNIDASGRTKAIKITGNSLANTINGGKGNDTLTGGSGADVFVYASSSGNDVVTDYAAGQDKIKITGAKISKTSVSGSDVILTVGNGSIRVKNGKGKKLSIYNNANSAITTVIGGSTSTSVTLTNSNTSPYAAASTIKNINASSRSTAIKIAGNSLVNSIVGGSGNDSLSGLAGADTLNGVKGNDTLTGGSGNDVFIYASSSGNDVITDYATGDKLSITGGKYTRTTVGNDVKFTVGNGSILLKNAKTKTITVSGTSTTIANTTTTTSNSVTLTNSTTSPYTAASTVKNINASNRTKAIQIKGNSLANSIIGGSGNDSLSGGDKADTLSGGKGNDTLTGGSGKDVFIFSAGNDVITDYTAGQDTIKLSSGTISTYSISGSDVILSVGSGSITIKNGKNKNISVTNSSGKTTTKVYPENTTPVNIDNNTVILTNSLDGDFDLSYYAIQGAPQNIDATANSTEHLSIDGDSRDNVIKAGSGGCYISGGSGDDTLYGGKGKDTFNWSIFSRNNSVIYNYEKGKDIITSNAVASIDGYEISGSDIILKARNSTMTIKGITNPSDILFENYGGQIDTYWYDKKTPNGISYSGDTVVLSDDLEGNFHLDYYDFEGAPQNIDASKLNGDFDIFGDERDNVIISGGKDFSGYVCGRGGNDTLYGGNGEDIFDIYLYYDENNTYSANHYGGSNIIYNYEKGKDKIWMQGYKKIDSYSISGNDIILKSAKTTVTVKGINKPEDLTVMNGSSQVDSYWYNGQLPDGMSYSNNTVILTNEFNGSFNLRYYALEDAPKDIDASALTGFSYIYGDERDNLMRGGSGSRNYLNGYGGNDTLYGHDGTSDTFAFYLYDSYDNGKSIIYNYNKDEDQIKFYGNKSISYKVSGSDIILTSDKNTITIKGITKASDLTIVNSSGQVDTYWYNGNLPGGIFFNASTSKSFREDSIDDLIQDDNYVTNEDSLSTILKTDLTDFSVGNIDTSDPTNLTVNRSIDQMLTYNNSKK